MKHRHLIEIEKDTSYQKSGNHLHTINILTFVKRQTSHQFIILTEDRFTITDKNDLRTTIRSLTFLSLVSPPSLSRIRIYILQLRSHHPLRFPYSGSRTLAATLSFSTHIVVEQLHDLTLFFCIFLLFFLI